MEQAVNQFNKGLQLDTHPMVQGNDTLSDALNATFITMNGNEVVLQNDMGNRRIDNAFLPSGYQPLGMKEYGGVIYVAAYNPLTNRGQIGSFPSPQRKVNIDNKNGATIDFNEFIAEENDDNGNLIHVINKEYIIIPISDKMVLHTGDKFSIYSQQIGDILPYLTLPSDTKNNLFTFQIGIFNSQNEFIDISDKLKLWDINGRQYFITSEAQVSLHETIADSELLRARNRLAINTYSQKMSSPLYLKAIINHIDNISYSITGEIAGSNTVNLEIEVTFYYNCIDYLSGSKRYFEIDFNGNTYQMSEQLQTPTYSQELEQYTAKYLYKINNLQVQPEEISGQKKYKYEIKFPLLHNYPDWTSLGLGYDPIYIKALNRSGELDLSKLDSDTLIFKGYRYYNDTSKEITTLIVNLESYPKKENISQLQFCTILRDPKTNNIVLGETEIIDQWRPGTGTITVQFPYTDLEKRKLYLFEFYYYNDLEKTRKGSEKWKGFYITTPIFNGNYVGEKGASLDAFKETGFVGLDGIIHYSYDIMNNIYIDDFSKIDKILLSPILNHSVTSIPIENKKNISGNYIQPLSTTLTDTTYTLKETNKIKNIINVFASVNNIEIYPSEVESLLEIQNINNPISNIKRSINETTLENSGIYTYSDGLKEIKTEIPLEGNVIEISEEYSHQNLEQNLQRIELISTINVNNSITGPLEKKSIHCDHLITSFGNLIKKYYYGQNQMDYITLRPPYITIDWEGDEYASIISSTSLDELKDATWNSAKEEHRAEKINGKSKGNTFYIDEVARDGISDFILSQCKGQLIVGEYSGDDWIGGFSPCIYNGIGTFYPEQNIKYIVAGNFKRYWLRISKKEYIPIFVYGPPHIPEESALDDFFNDCGVFNVIFSNIPHYYEYETGGKTLQEKIINPAVMSKTIEFEVNSNIDTIITENIGLIGENNYYGLTNEGEISSRGSKVSKKISFMEGVITSNEDFIEEVENLSNYHISNAAMFGDEDNHQLQIRDCEGNIFNSLYVYYDDSEKNSNVIGNVFKKSYVADKFYIPDLDIYMPELKSSRKLYGGEFGEHGLINEYVYPVLNIRRKILNLVEDRSKDIPNDLSSPANSYDKGLWDKTFIQWEGTGNKLNYQLPLRTRNIFNRKIILNFNLTTPDANGDSSMYNSSTGQNEWIDYDTYIEQLNNNNS